MLRGGGLLHRRWANCTPPPHDLEHAPQGPQELQLPWLDAWEGRGEEREDERGGEGNEIRGMEREKKEMKEDN